MGKPVIKTAEEIEGMRAAGRLAARTLRHAARMVTPGITTLEIDQAIGNFIRKHEGVSAFLGYRGFPANACISVNEAVIHGIGNQNRLQFGDIVKLDIGVRYRGFIGDVAMTVPVGGCSPLAQKLMDVTVDSLYKGISAACGNAAVSNIGRKVQACVEGAGFGVVREYCGHGVGRSLHEDPQVPNYVDGKSNDRLRPGVTIAIEPMVTVGSPLVDVLSDKWTVVTRDRQLSAHFEHTVLVTEGEPEILTRDEEGPLY
ncbi:MAG TPA: type I methionyl aminopeptidase [Candidatus Limnocylindria bacterium]|jgi:methionyl aminopeptidase|nr:type I methionyl aminopeptidase [Candidatus Limnocylindria bacterium]